jgi:hypothetical protein
MPNGSWKIHPSSYHGYLDELFELDHYQFHPLGSIIYLDDFKRTKL